MGGIDFEIRFMKNHGCGFNSVLLKPAVRFYFADELKSKFLVQYA
jgi:hypothetical protein